MAPIVPCCLVFTVAPLSSPREWPSIRPLAPGHPAGIRWHRGSAIPLLTQRDCRYNPIVVRRSPMSSASLAVAHRTHPDSARIAALSAAIALNLAVVLIASRPITPLQLARIHLPAAIQQVRLITAPPRVPPPPAVELKPLPHPPTLPQVRPRPLPLSPPAAMPDTDGQLAAPPVSEPTLLPGNTAPGPVTGAAPVEASLAYRSSPLHFPAVALRQRMHGRVLLRVLVDETGAPVEVTVEQGSGYALLDRSARDQVLASWRFQPAMVNGHAVRAWARVPVNFDLRQ
jgi:periplasmic protein TonB